MSIWPAGRNISCIEKLRAGAGAPLRINLSPPGFFPGRSVEKMFVDPHKIPEGTVIRRLGVLRETAPGKLLHLQMVVQAFATDRLFVTR